MTSLWRIVRPDGEDGYADLERTGSRLEWWTNQPRALGDFTWIVGAPLPLLSPALAEELELFGGWRPERVAVGDHQVRASDAKPGRRVPAPLLAQMRELVALRVTKRCAPAPASTIRVVRPGPAPVFHWGGRSPVLEIAMKDAAPRSILEGVESWESVAWQPGKGMLREHHPRESGAGLFVDAAELGSCGLFVLDVAEHWLFCTDAVKQLVEERGWTNVTFLEAGEVA